MIVNDVVKTVALFWNEFVSCIISFFHVLILLYFKYFYSPLLHENTLKWRKGLTFVVKECLIALIYFVFLFTEFWVYVAL